MDNLNDFLKHNTVDGGFLQSEHWENFQKKLNRRTFRIEKEGEFSALVLNYGLPIVGNYFFIPRGPVIKIQNKCPNELINLAKDNHIGWIRVEPQRKRELEIIKEHLGSKYRMIQSEKNHEPAQTLMLDLKKSETSILREMKSKTRYNVRISQKREVEIFISREEKYFDKFS